MEPEERARQQIDELLEAAGWEIQDFEKLNLGSSLGVAVREFPIKGAGRADYLLFVDRKAVGAIEAKKEGVTLGAVSEQTEKYLTEFPEEIPHIQRPLPFSCESTGIETYFRDLRDPDSKSRRIFAFHKPETLLERVQSTNTLRTRLRDLPPLLKGNLYDCQSEAIHNLERSFGQNRSRALIQMATGSGKTFTAVTACYRLVKHANAKRILFLVDRANLGRQTEKEFQQYVTPDDGRKFTELYNVQRLNSNTIDPVNRVCISTIQRIYSMLSGRGLEEDLEKGSLYEDTPSAQAPLEVSYNPDIPIEAFDFIIVDECHRSIYNLWRQVKRFPLELNLNKNGGA
jgi:type I restriction enzyme R subunit